MTALKNRLRKESQRNVHEHQSNQKERSPLRKRSSMKAGMPEVPSISSRLQRRKLSKKESTALASGYDSSESEGTKALNVQYEREPQEFIAIGSTNYEKLATLDKARLYLL